MRAASARRIAQQHLQAVRRVDGGGALIGGPPWAILLATGEPAEDGKFLLGGTAIFLAGALGMIIAAAGATCDPDDKHAAFRCAD